MSYLTNKINKLEKSSEMKKEAEQQHLENSSKLK